MLQDVTPPPLIPSHGFLKSIHQHRSSWTIDTMLHYDIPMGLDLAAPPLRLESGQRAFFTLPPPGGQMRGIEPFPS
jgi:hypothetical protein